MTKHARLWSLLVVIALPLLVNAPVLTNFVKGDFALLYGQFSTHLVRGATAGYPQIDPTLGFNAEPVGRRLLDDVVHGRAPWWNPYEGAGFPMGESIGNAVFFPFSLLLGLPRGQAIDVTALEITAGIGTLLLLRRLGLGWLPAVAGAGLYELNGAVCWIAGDIANTTPFLPWLIYGIERVRSAVMAEEPFAWGWVAGALALSLYAGFPESAYFNGLVALAWSVVRFFQMHLDLRGLFARGLVAGGAVGILMATPILLAFYDELRISNAGEHLSGGFAGLALPGAAQPMVLLPYLFGPIFAYGPVAAIWGNVGGFAGIGLAVFGFAALFGRQERALRRLLAAWTVLALGASFGVPVLHALFVHIPLVSLTAYYRYLPQSYIFSLAVLTAFALHDAASAERAALAKRYAFAVVATLAALGVGLAHARPLIAQMRQNAPGWLFGSLELGIAVLLAVAVAVQLPSARARISLFAAALLAETLVNFMLPVLAYPRDGALDLAAIGFLQRNLGLQRFYTLGPIQPNYGTYYGIASINYNDLPVPNRWIDYVHARLDPYSDTINFTGQHPAAGPGVPSRAEEVRRHADGFRAAGVKYVVVPGAADPFRPAYDAPVGAGPPAVTPLRAGAPVTLVLTGKDVPGAPLRGVGILQGNYGHTADGIMVVRACNADRSCVSGSRPVSESTDNTPFEVPLSKPLALRGRPVALTFAVRGETVPEALWTFGPEPSGAQAVSVAGKPLPNATLSVELLFEAKSAGPKRAYADSLMTIYELDRPRPYAEAPGCTLQVRSRTSMEADCPRASVLHRLELFFPGWAASVNREPAAIGPFDGAFQQVALPKGRSSITFSFSPPGIAFGYAAFAAGAAVLALLALRKLRRGSVR